MREAANISRLGDRAEMIVPIQKMLRAVASTKRRGTWPVMVAEIGDSSA
jgi:hypothetical protein